MAEIHPPREPNGAQRITPDERAPVAQWIGLFLAPAAFFAHLQITYVLVPWACVRHGDLWIHVSGLLSVLLALAGTFAAWHTWGRAERESGEAGGSVPRTGFVGLSGLGLSAIITLVLVGQWLTAFFVSPCQ